MKVNIGETRFSFTLSNDKLAKEIISKYPESQRFSAIMPLLTLAQKQNGGYLNDPIIQYLSTYLNVSAMSFYEVAKFYTMYKFNPVGKYHISFCKSVVCAVLDADDLYDHCKKITGVVGNEVSNDGLFSVQQVECLGTCVNAPVMTVNNLAYENLTKVSLSKIIDDIKKGLNMGSISIVQRSATYHVVKQH